VGGGFGVAKGSGIFERWRGGIRAGGPFLCVRCGCFGHRQVPERKHGRAWGARGGVAFGPVAFERILGRRESAGDRPCAVMPLEPEPVSGGDLGGGRSS
jgi:hypothetical protein